MTRYISHYSTPSGFWASTNDRHLEMTTSLQEAVQISQSGQRPHVHRYRYPQCVLLSRFLDDSACLMVVVALWRWHQHSLCLLEEIPTCLG